MHTMEITRISKYSGICRTRLLDITEEQLQEFYDDGYTVHDTLDWAEWKLDEEMFPEFS